MTDSSPSTTSGGIGEGVPRIIKLDEVVVNRIAAGEVIQRPANAIKELVENCLDAGSKNITVTVKSGGLKLLQVTDDGCGIRHEDLHVACERFTTSKLSEFNDLKRISTYGFRGEALASVSHIAHLSILSRPATSPCAYRAKYEDSRLVPLEPGQKAEPKPCAGNKGTQITVEDLFYNVSVRRKALKNPAEEHAKITDVISKYAIHNASVSFTLKKAGENIACIRTNASASVVDNIKAIYGPQVAQELLELSHSDEKLSFSVSGRISNANYSMKKCVFLLFINHRLVDSQALRKALDAVYANYLPKDKHPFLYISLEINPVNIDVNVHPTKHEVKFLHEDMIIESIQKAVEARLLGSNESRNFFTQTLLPNTALTDAAQQISDIVDPPVKSDNVQRVYDHQMVRTDSRERTMDAFFTPTPKINSNTPTTVSTNTSTQPSLGDSSKASDTTDHHTASIESSENNAKELFNVTLANEKETILEQNCESNKPSSILLTDDLQITNDSKTVKRKRSPDRSHSRTSSSSVSSLPVPQRDIGLSSIRTLRKRIDEQENTSLKSLLEDHKFVGCVNDSLMLVQHLTRLYLVNVERVSAELFYQILLFNFGNFGFIELSPPAPLYELAMLALQSPHSGWTQSDGSKEELASYVVSLLSSKSEMLLDYFSIEVSSSGDLISLPLLLERHSPRMTDLPMFMLRLATEVDWDSEEACFETLCRECSQFYAMKPDPLKIPTDSENQKLEDSFMWTIEHVICPSLRSSIAPPRKFTDDGTFLEVANLPDLYKVFERC